MSSAAGALEGADGEGQRAESGAELVAWEKRGKGEKQ